MNERPTSTPDTDPLQSQLAQAEEFACHAARLLADNRCDNVVVLNLRGLSQVADFFVIGSGTSERQLRSVADDLKLLAGEEDQGVYHRHGRDTGEWVVMDFVDVVAHLFLTSHRQYYDLEGLWGDAKRINWRDRTEPGQFARLRAQVMARRRGEDVESLPDDGDREP